jgi:hypothetical protein
LTEPCPFCGARIEPIRRDAFKQCPRCGGKWYEPGGGWRSKPYAPGAGGAGAIVRYRPGAGEAPEVMWHAA